MHIQLSAYWMQKAGNAPEEYEDAFAPAAAPGEACQEFRCAVADGATETSFSGLWARILVEAFVDKRLKKLDDETLRQLSRRWRQEIDQRTRHKPLPWYAEEKLYQGAFSSLMGLVLRGDGVWRALCIGDSCLFHIRPRQAIYAFPYHMPEQFNNHPALISTNADGNVTLKARVAHGRWQDGDYFLLLTDALAHFFMSQRHFRSRLVDGELDQTGFEPLIEQARGEQICRNDDVTFLKITPGFGDVPGVVA